MKDKIIKRLNDRFDSLEVGNSQFDILCDLINQFYDENPKSESRTQLVSFLANRIESLEMGNSQFEILSDIILE